MTAKLTVPAPSEIRDAYLRVVRSELIARGVPNPNVGKDSDHWVRAEALSQQQAPVYANTQFYADAMMPDSAEDDDLLRIMGIFGVSDVGATPSFGPVVFNASASTFIAAGTQLADPRGQFFQVSTGATYAPGANIPIIGLDKGKSTNLPQGTVLQWVTPPSFSAATALVGVGGLIGGADTDTNESRRNRLYSFFRNPPQAGNWSQIKAWAEAASASVQSAFVYQAINGPATVGVVVLGPLAFDATLGWTREVSAPVLTTVQSYLAARIPEGIKTLVVTPTDTHADGTAPDVDSDVVIGLELPLSVAAGGEGGGWVDPEPWPSLHGTATRVFVSSVITDSHIRLTSDDPSTTPTLDDVVPGETTVCWFSAANFAAGLDPLVIATVTGATGSTGSIAITLDTPFTGVDTSQYVFPNAERIQEYASAFLASCGQMGPGQWTSHPQILASGGKRRPFITPAGSQPSDYTGVQLRAISDVGEEVKDVQYLFRSPSPLGVPGNTTSASPFIAVPGVLGFFNKIPS